jgi:hypothetical protein
VKPLNAHAATAVGVTVTQSATRPAYTTRDGYHIRSVEGGESTLLSDQVRQMTKLSASSGVRLPGSNCTGRGSMLELHGSMLELHGSMLELHGIMVLAIERSVRRMPRRIQCAARHRWHD